MPIAAIPRVGKRWLRHRFACDAESLALSLLGHWLVRTLPRGVVLAGRIVETEAYLGVMDAASHAYKGRRTARNEAMYGEPGTAYVYFTYGMHHCFNVVCGKVGEPAAVLIRAVEPTVGVERMRTNRSRKPGKAVSARRKILKDEQLCAGPARLCQAFGIDRSMNAADMVRENRVYVAEPPDGYAPLEESEIVRTTRIGVAYAGAWASSPLRFYVASSPHVSVR
jgi:DNA-3-methyladenine glycosylase